jgi:RNA polymerase sigma-70 factor (ECF subfamily)
LGEALLANAGLIDDDARVRARSRERFWADEFEEIFRRGDSNRFVSNFASDLLLGWSNGKLVRGREHLAAEIDGDLAVGVRLDVERVMTNATVSVIEGRFTNPREAPDHCPPGIALVVFGQEDVASALRMHLARRRPRADGD